MAVKPNSNKFILYPTIMSFPEASYLIHFDSSNESTNVGNHIFLFPVNSVAGVMARLPSLGNLGAKV